MAYRNPILRRRHRRLLVEFGGASGLLVSDSFNRADSAVSLGSTDGGSLGPLPWTAHSGTFGIGANAAAFITGGVANDRNATIDAGAPDVTAGVTISTYSGVDNVRLVFRFSDNSNYWILSGNAASAWDLYKRVGGAFTLVGSGGAAVASGDVLSVSLSGASIVATVNGITVVTATDAFNSTATRYGIGCNTGDPGNRWDNFSVTA